jgi:hypothetical protein
MVVSGIISGSGVSNWQPLLCPPSPQNLMMFTQVYLSFLLTVLGYDFCVQTHELAEYIAQVPTNAISETFEVYVNILSA